MTTTTVPAPARIGQARFIALLLLAGIACAALPARAQPAAGEQGWHGFHGIWTAMGKRQAVHLGEGRRASIADFNGSLMLTGEGRPAIGFLAEAIVFNDSTTGMVGRAVWTDERGDKAFSELRGEATAQGNRIIGSFVGGTGRYAGATGSYEFAWRFLLEGEDGGVQGQSVGLTGRIRTTASQAAVTGATR